MAINMIDGYIYKIIARLGLAADVPTLEDGEIGWDRDTKTFRVGDASASPPRVMTTKSTGIFDYANLTYARYPRIELPPGGTVDGVDVSTLNQANGFLVRTGAGVFNNRQVVSGNGTISIVNGTGLGGDLDLRVSDTLIASLTPPTFFVSNTPPASPRIGDHWHDTDGTDGTPGNDDDGAVYIRDSNGITEFWTQISNNYATASESEAGIVRFATQTEAAARTAKNVALNPFNVTAFIGAGNDFRTVINATLTAPPGSPAARDAYLVPIGASGAWASQVGRIATYDGSDWLYEQLRVGAIVVDNNKTASNSLRYLQQTSALTWSAFSSTTTAVGLSRMSTGAEIDAATLDNTAISAKEGALHVRRQPLNFFTAGGSATALTITPSPAFTSKADFLNVVFRIVVPSTNTGPCTLNINGLGTDPLRFKDAALISGDIPAGSIIQTCWDGTHHQILSVSSAGLNRRPTGSTIIIYSSSTTYTVPEGVRKVKVFLWGGGAGGGPFMSGQNTAGGGGSAGGFNSTVIDVVTGDVLTITIGAGGAGGTTLPGGNGGLTSVLKNGVIALTAEGGTAGTPGTPGSNTLPVQGGGFTSGSFGVRGGLGKAGWAMLGDGGAVYTMSGDGGDSPFGGGGGTVGGPDGIFPGGGGAGGVSLSSGPASNGGNGAGGAVMLEI